MNKIREYIEKFDTIILHGHIRPDGDCIGSQYGLYYLIKDNYPNKRYTLQEKLVIMFLLLVHQNW